MEYQTNSHCKYLIALHLILLVKNRKQLLQGEVGDFVKLKIIEIASRSEFNMEEVRLAQKAIFGSNKPLGLTGILSVQSAIYPLKQFVNTFKNKVSLAIHPTDAAPRRSVGFLDRFDKS